ncbi:hypothetical protein [Nocardia sp. NPDC049149]|uniref:hypothetical protein n=1 Tax=Nocardia sp. NPDC049149 TaxID=3364315 RepID=UPI00371EF759
MRVEFVDQLPPKRPGRGSDAFMEEFAAALRRRPGVWAKWPTPIQASTAGGYTTKILKGVFPAFPSGFDATSRNGQLYVRYVGRRVADGRA